MIECTCGHRADARFVSEAAYLQARLDWVRDRIRAGDVAPGQAAGLTARAPAASAPLRLPVQTILLSVGALLLVVAASVFTAVAWPRLEPGGQVAIVLLVTGLVAFLSVVLRTRLHGTAEALAALAVGLVIVDAVALPALGLAPQEWLDFGSLFWLVLFAGLAATAVGAGRLAGLRSWSWTGWGSSAAALGAASAALVGTDEPVSQPLALAMAVLTVGGVLLVTGSYVASWTRADRRPMMLAGSVALLLSGGVLGAIGLVGDAAGAVAFTTGLTAAVLAVMAAAVPADDSTRPARRSFFVGAIVLASVAVGLLASLLAPNALVAVGVATLGGLLLLVGVARSTSLIGLVPAVPLCGTWLVTAVPDAGEGVIGMFALVVALALLAAAWLGAGHPDITWLAWPAAVSGYAAFLLLVPVPTPVALEAWTLPGAAMLAVAGAVSCRGRDTSSLEMVGPALTVALLPSAFATWFSPWVSGVPGATSEHVVRLVLVLAVGGVLMVLGARTHALGLLLPATAAVLVAGSAQLWTGLASLPQWIALALVGMLLVLAGARFEWVRDEGRRARTWVHQMT